MFHTVRAKHDAARSNLATDTMRTVPPHTEPRYKESENTMTTKTYTVFTPDGTSTVEAPSPVFAVAKTLNIPSNTVTCEFDEFDGIYTWFIYDTDCGLGGLVNIDIDSLDDSDQ